MDEYIGLDSNIEYITKDELKCRFGFTKDFLAEYFPKPHVLKCVDKRKPNLHVWKTRDVERILLNKELQKAYEETINVTQDEETAVVRAFLKEYDIKALSETATPLRNFVLHVGPTNSGKTYNALQYLKKADNGVYLGPLRLLALEVFDTLNQSGYPCNLLTGQEQEDTPSAKLTASTIELCNYNIHYDVAIIDEAQLISDEFRGSCWTKALFQINADEVHVCLAPEALNLIKYMIEIMGCTYTIDQCERKTPLIFSGIFKDLTFVQPGDALIAFSRKTVLAIAAALEDSGIKTSVLYGSLPPKARRSEVDRFTNGDTQVVVATDAIGMGVSLPIKRVVFCETTKFDGKKFRHLRTQEIKQIAGRAGRYGKYPIGEVLTMKEPELIQKALEKKCKDLEKFTMPFPSEVFNISKDIGLVLSEWERLFPCEKFRRKSMETELHLYRELVSMYPKKLKDTNTVFKLISAPFDVKDWKLTHYWLNCCANIFSKHGVSHPIFDTRTLEGCELQYKALDLCHYLHMAFNLPEDSTIEKDRLCEKINEFLLKDKDRFLMKCRRCGKKLAFDQKVGLCDKCYKKLAWW